jgi:IPT/TIG domain
VLDRASGVNLKSKRGLSDAADPNPAPAITGLTPSTVAVGVNGFTLTVTGTNFVSLSKIEWNGDQIPTEYVSSSELQAQVSASVVETVYPVSINVFTSAPGGGTSNASPFTIVPLESPVPFIVSFYPNFVKAGSSGLPWQSTAHSSIPQA